MGADVTSVIVDQAPPVIETLDYNEVMAHPHMHMALDIAARYHAGTQRWFTDEPYIVHPRRVAELVRRNGGTMSQILAAMLHDVVEEAEDPLYAAAEIAAVSFPPEMMLLLTVLSRPPGMSYSEYIQRVVDHEPARLVKYCDTIDNLSTLPLGNPMHKRYVRNLTVLHVG